ncbi:MAG: response regulator [Pseudomonadota bacterium]|nr:response regulator [Pseudomonadota bacterium]
MEFEGKVNVLLVDDQAEGLLALEAMLEPLGQNLVMARSGREALRRLLSHEFAVILLDVQMPGMDGFETAGLIRQRERTRYTPIIFLTAGHKTEAQVFRGYAVGAVDYLFKPIDPEILRSKVLTFVELAKKTELVRKQTEQLVQREREARHLLAELEQKNCDLKAANQELEAFSHSVSHDLRAPLRHIDGFASLLASYLEASLDEKGRQYLTKISGAARQMGELIDDLLTFSRLGRTELRRTRVGLRDLVEDVLQTLEPETAGRDIAWAIGDLPEVQVDPQLLRLVLQNLIGNALKYTRPRPQARIEMGARREGAEIVLFIRDNGVGFDMRYVDRLFDVFQRLHTSAEFEGTGIGLATVRRIVHRYGGRVWAEGEVDRGACFYVALPHGGVLAAEPRG